MNLKAKIGWLISKLLYEWNPIKRMRKRRFYAHFIKSKDLCFDVGAHLGDRTHTWLGLGAKVVAFEPQPKFIDYLLHKFSNSPNFSLEPIGLGDSEGKATLAMSSLYPTLSTLAGESWEQEIKGASNLSIEFDAEIEIEVKTLDKMIAQHGLPKFCKIDVEGFEYEVLKGLTQPIHYLSFEFLSFSEQRMKNCLVKLLELGYTKFNWSYKETFELRFEDWVDAEKVFEDASNFKNGVYSGDVYACFE